LPKAPFFSRLGLFVVERFLDADLCAALRAELRCSPRAPATVERDGHYLVDSQVRKTARAAVSELTAATVSERLGALRPSLERHFETALTEYEPPYFAVYTTGDYFKPHADTGRSADAPERIRGRKVTAVIFLNDQTDAPEPESYGGGALTFYGLFTEPPWDAMGLPLVGESGLLVAFRADAIHEVTTITHGERYTVVSRFS
jgi:predicted 2-oxoglutarate/Fe(II)-dependent dioxygenase YbiX